MKIFSRFSDGGLVLSDNCKIGNIFLLQNQERIGSRLGLVRGLINKGVPIFKPAFFSNLFPSLTPGGGFGTNKADFAIIVHY